MGLQSGIFCMGICLWACLVYAQTSTSLRLISHAKEYDGKFVVYEGEVIGEIMPRGNFSWINVNDGQNALGIWLEKSLVKEILYTGSYKAKGDWVRVEGVFHRACPEHGGDLDIHAQGLLRVKSGRILAQRLNPGKRELALALFIILCLAWILRRLKIR